MRDIFEENEKVGSRDKKSIWVCCPFHNDSFPSLRVYEHHFYCYGCQIDGTLEDLYKLRYITEYILPFNTYEEYLELKEKFK